MKNEGLLGEDNEQPELKQLVVGVVAWEGLVRLKLKQPQFYLAGCQHDVFLHASGHALYGLDPWGGDGSDGGEGGHGDVGILGGPAGNQG